jgi:hypothetical protein
VSCFRGRGEVAKTGAFGVEESVGTDGVETGVTMATVIAVPARQHNPAATTTHLI